MICYRDRTFCSFHKDCMDGPTCTRALTSSARAGADAIKLPISQYVNKPACFWDKGPLTDDELPGAPAPE